MGHNMIEFITRWFIWVHLRNKTFINIPKILLFGFWVDAWVTYQLSFFKFQVIKDIFHHLWLAEFSIFVNKKSKWNNRGLLGEDIIRNFPDNRLILQLFLQLSKILSHYSNCWIELNTILISCNLSTAVQT